MRYFGGKTRTCKEIADIIKSLRYPDQLFVSPFVGGGWVESLLVDGAKYCCDKHPYLIAMYQELQKGWIPPKTLTKEEYDYIKGHKDEQPHLTGFVGFGCSFAGKWFGGYAKDKTNRNFCLNAHNSIMKKMKSFRNNTRFHCTDYKMLDPMDSIVYCDPPYQGTTEYSMGEFNHALFWETMRIWAKKNVVLVSEYNAPSDIKCIWQKSVKLDIRDKNNTKLPRVEKLFKV